ncbi:MAG: ABC transporter permease [Polaromonas sp.]
MNRIKNRVLLLLVTVGIAAASGLAFLTHAPNRLVSGTGISLAQVLHGSAGFNQSFALLATLGPSLLLVVAVFMRRRLGSHILVALAATALLTGLVELASRHATRLASIAADPASGLSAGIERTSFGGAFWILAALCWLAASDAIGHLGLKPALRLLASAAVITPVVFCIASGRLGQLSLLREYANRQDVFNAALLQHAQIVLASLAPSLLIGVPLGIASVRTSRRMNALRPALFATLNIIQTIPSIALFGLLMAPLALLAASVPLLAQWGIKGVGMAPAVIALTLYSLLPVVRSTAAGLGQVPWPVIEAALGMGLTPRQIFWRVQAPLALPVFLAGLRVATVQTIGLAVVAALIGAGGFGAIMFQGLLSGALDLVLLGVVPVVAMAIVVDALLKTIATSLNRDF